MDSTPVLRHNASKDRVSSNDEKFDEKLNLEGGVPTEPEYAEEAYDDHDV